MCQLSIALSNANIPCVAPYPLSAPVGNLLVYTVLALNLTASISLYIGKVLCPDSEETETPFPP